jgi:hypothetical protein
MKYIKLFEKLVGEISINNMLKYLDGMSYGIQDKLFFIDKIDFDCVVDFGSANGVLLKEIKSINPNIVTIAYDIDEKMLNILKKEKKIDFVSNNLSEIFEQLKYFNNPVLVLSSVIHEIYSYSNKIEIEMFWNVIFNSTFKYIIIRDMMPKENYKYFNLTDYEINEIYNYSEKYQIDTFEKKWGKISDNYLNVLHYLLKYKYIENWERELNENYLPISIEKLKKIIPKNWSIYFEEHYLLPYLKKIVKDDFDIKLKNPSHLKIILKNGS